MASEKAHLLQIDIFSTLFPDFPPKSDTSCTSGQVQKETLQSVVNQSSMHQVAQEFVQKRSMWLYIVNGS